MSTSAISLYNILRKKLGEKETTELMEYVKSEVKSEFDAKASVFMTKDDKIELIDRIKNDKAELIDRINKSKTETITWIVGIGILQFILSILSKKFL